MLLQINFKFSFFFEEPLPFVCEYVFQFTRTSKTRRHTKLLIGTRVTRKGFMVNTDFIINESPWLYFHRLK